MPTTYEMRQEALRIWKRDHINAFPQHLHKYVELMYIKKGKINCTVDFCEYELRGGDLLLVFPDQIHSHEDSTKDAEIYVMIFPVDHTMLSEVFDSKLPLSPVLKNISTEEIDHLFKTTCDEYHGGTAYSLAAARGYAQVLISRVLSQTELQDARQLPKSLEKRLVEYCTDNYKDAISLNSIAEKFGYNPSYLSHIFSQKFRTSFLKFVNALRVDDAKKRLRSNEKITQIALDCGFGSIRNFNRVFKEATGKTPKEYRESKKR